MKFEKELLKNMVQEWYDAYLDYAFLKLLLKPMMHHEKRCLHLQVDKDLQIYLTNTQQQFLDSILHFATIFESVLSNEAIKFEAFMEIKIVNLFRQWRTLKINTHILNSMNQSNIDFVSQFQGLRDSYFLFLQQISLMNQYYVLNYEGFRKIIKKYQKLIKQISR